MTLRRKLLLSFTGIILVGLIAFCFVAYKITLLSVADREGSLLLKTLTERGAHIIEELPANADSEQWLEAIQRFDTPDTLVLVGNERGLLATSRALDDYFGLAGLEAWTSELFKQPQQYGSKHINGQSYIWASTPLSDRDLSLLHINRSSDELIVPNHTLVARLIVSMIVILWVSAWIVLIYATTISRRLEQQTRELERHAYCDTLTGLSNRNLINQSLEQLLTESGKEHGQIALFVIDLDHFKDINDTLGHRVGDLLLQEVAQRLRHALRDAAVIARMGGDEFGIVYHLIDLEHATLIAEKIDTALDEPFQPLGQLLNIDASIGIALSQTDGNDAATLIRHAEVAMYQAKSEATGYAYYDVLKDPHSLDRLALTGELRLAIQHRELSLHFQPKLDLHRHEVLATEALLRWNHPVRGMVSPADFIPLAERTGLIRQLTQCVLEEGISRCAEWQRGGLEIGIAINLSARNVGDESIPGQVAKLLDHYGLEPHHLTLEITETAIVNDPKRALDVLGCLNTMGVQLSIDDFGTGYTSLSQLNQLPVKEIKIDRTFISDMLSNRGHETIVHTIIDLAHDMGYRVVAEGVEDQATQDRLASLGCDILQGYHICRPIPGEALVAWLHDHRAQQPARRA